MFFSVHYDEIGIKGSNRYIFEDALVTNIKAQLPFVKIEKLHDRILLEFEETENSQKNQVTESLKKTFGISWFSESQKVDRELKIVSDYVVDKVKQKKIIGAFGVFCKRIDKKFPINSQDFAKEVGSEVAIKNKLKVDLENPELWIYIDIMVPFTLVYFDKIKGAGGLPVGVSGRVLCLLSGGIDSPVAALLMMKRGCAVDFVHFYSQATAKEVEESKIFKLLKKLKEYQPRKTEVYLVPYQQFYLATIKIDPRQELVLFRRFIAKVAEKLITNQLGIVTGDSLAQVASQTLENLFTTTKAIGTPIYRPLLTCDKKDIIDLAKKFGTYEISIEEYKDCCSIVSTKHPDTRTNEIGMVKIEDEIGIEKIIGETIVKVHRQRV